MTTSVAPRPVDVTLLKSKAEVAQKLMTQATRVDSAGGQAVTKAERAPIEKAMRDVFDAVNDEAAASGKDAPSIAWDVKEIASVRAQHSALRDYKGWLGEFLGTLRGLKDELGGR